MVYFLHPKTQAEGEGKRMKLSQDEHKALLLPISETQPQGRYLKADSSLYRPLRNLFNIAQSSLRKLLQQTEAEDRALHQQMMLSDQAALADALFPVLRGTARDLSLTGWFINSQILLDPTLEALERCLSWFSQQITAHWESLPPQHCDDAGAGEIKLQELALFLGSGTESCLFYSAVLLLPVTDDIAYYHYLQQQRRAQTTDFPPLTTDARAAARQRIDLLSACLAHLQPLVPFFTVQNSMTDVFPGFFIHLLTDYRQAVMTACGLPLSEKPAEESSQQPHTEPETVAEKVRPAQAAPHPGMPDLHALSQRNHYNRDVALHQLRDISLYFRRSEPHSPLSYLLEKSIRWGQMSLSELWQEILLEDNSSLLDRIFSLTGLNERQMATLPELGNEPGQAENKAVDECPDSPADTRNTGLRW